MRVLMTLFEELNQKREVSRRKQRKTEPLPPPSPFQKPVLDAVLAGVLHIFVGATAGAGKTKLLQMIAELITQHELLPPGEQAVFAAFNVHVKKNLEKVIPKEFSCKTINGIGDLICKQNLDGLVFEPKKYERLMTEIVKGSGVQAPAARQELRERLEASVQLHVGHDLGLDIELSDWAPLMRELDAPVLGAEQILHTLTLRTLRQGLALLQEKREMSFIDQTLAPSVFGWRITQPLRFLLVDEMQDLTKGHMKLLRACTDEYSCVIGVGDRSQSLYGFAGADTEAIEQFIELFQAQEFPLSICYRCPSRHVELARPYTDQIESAPGAIDGILEDIDPAEFRASVQPGDLVLCRTNAPLIDVCYDLIRDGIPAIVRGRDLSRSLVAFARDAVTWDGRRVNRKKLSDDLTLEDFPDKLDAYCTELSNQIIREAEEQNTDPGMRLAALADKNSVLNLVLEQGQAKTISDLVFDIRKLFQGKPEESVILSTIHGAKGLEADNIFILKPDLLPHPKARTEQALKAERCAIFVALSRAKVSLRFVHDEPDFVSLIPDHLRSPAPDNTSEFN